MTPIIVKMELDDKEYKSVFRYREMGVRTPPALNYLYVKKYSISSKLPPQVIKVTVEEVDGNK